MGQQGTAQNLAFGQAGSPEGSSTRSNLSRLRSDLVWSHRTVRGQEVWFLKDPRRRTYFRFSAPVAFILKSLESETHPEGLAEAFEQRFGQPLEHEDLELILQQAAQASLLLDDEAESPQAVAEVPGTEGAAPGRRRERQSERVPSPSDPLLGRLLHWKIGAFDPDDLLTSLERRLRLLFTHAAAAAWAALIASAAAVAIANLPVLVAEKAFLFRWETLAVLLPTLLVVTVFHEFGHGLACKHFGGEVREMGFLLIYFQPALYCDISDAWMLDRRARLWSIAGGTWVQLALWSLSVFVWRVTVPESYVHAAALVVVAVAGIGAFLNMIPFIKLDGYYFLSDWLELPNLRARAFAHLRDSLLRALGADPVQARPEDAHERPAARPAAVFAPLPPQDAREARIFWLYGLSAAGLSSGLLLYSLVIAHGFVASRFGGGCVAFLWMAVAGLLARPFGAVAAPVGVAWAQVLRKPRLSRASVTLLTLSALLAALFLIHWELRVAAEMRFEPLRRADVRSEISGIVESVAVEEGQEVREGDVLIELSSREYRAGLEQAQAELEKARAQLTLLVRGTREEEIRSAESRLEKALTREEYARRDYAKAQDLFGQKIIPLQELLAAEEEMAVRQKEVKEVRGQLDLLRAGSRPEEIERVRAEVARLESVARVARENLDRAILRAPISGRVVTPHTELLRGQKVEPGSALVQIVDTRRLRAEVEVPEAEAAEVRPGQKVKIKARGFPDRAFWGEVVSVASAAEADPGGQRAAFLPAPQSRIRIYTEVENAEGLLKPEMTGNAKIYCGKRPLIQLITRRLVRYVRTEFWF